MRARQVPRGGAGPEGASAGKARVPQRGRWPRRDFGRTHRYLRERSPSGEVSPRSQSGLQQKTEVPRGGRDAIGASAGNAEAPRADSGTEVWFQREMLRYLKEGVLEWEP